MRPVDAPLRRRLELFRNRSSAEALAPPNHLTQLHRKATYRLHRLSRLSVFRCNARLHGGRPKFTESGPSSARYGPNLTQIGQSRPTSSEFGLAWAELGQILPKFDQIRAQAGQRRPISSEPGPSSVKYGPKFGPSSGQIWPTRSEFDRTLPPLWPNRAKFGRSMGQIGSHRPDFACEMPTKPKAISNVSADLAEVNPSSVESPTDFNQSLPSQTRCLSKAAVGGVSPLWSPPARNSCSVFVSCVSDVLAKL